jgi:hypothetical protein
MNTSLTKSDYIKILNYYKLSIPTSTKTIKNKAEQILAEKLCNCIKNVGPNNNNMNDINETKAIGVCTKTVINRKGFRRGTFKCNKKNKTSRAITLFKRTKRVNKTNKRKA